MIDDDEASRTRPEWLDTLALVSVAAVAVLVGAAVLLWLTRPTSEPPSIAAADATVEVTALPAGSGPAPLPTVVVEETPASTSAPVPNTAVAPEPGSMYGDLSDSQIDAFVTSLAFPPNSLATDSLVSFGRSTCTRLDAIRSDGPLDKNNVAEVKAELDEMVSLFIADGAALSVFGANDAERQLRRIDHFAAKYFCPQFYTAVAAAHPEISE